MSQNHAPQAHITTVAEFPPGSFLENLVVRADGSVLITEVNHRGLWYVPPSNGHVPVEPMHLHTFDEPTVGIVELELDVVLVCCKRPRVTPPKAQKLWGRRLRVGTKLWNGRRMHCRTVIPDAPIFHLC